MISPRSLARAAAVTVALLVAAGCSGGDDPAPDDGAEQTASTDTAPTTTPSTVPPDAIETGFDDLDVGQCFDTIDDPSATDLAVWTFDCAIPHTFEVYDRIDYEGERVEGGSYPGIAAVQDWSEQACHDRFEAFIGTRWTLSELEIQLWWPTEESWGRGDRSVICAVLPERGGTVTGTLRGAAR